MDRTSKLWLVLMPPLIMALVSAGAWLTVERFMVRDANERATHEVRSHARVAAEMVRDLDPVGGNAAFGALADRLGAASGLRVTYIHRDGRVLGDSRLTSQEIARVENHGNRPEVIAAYEHGEGVAKRYSTTLGANLLYVAILYGANEARGVARAARPLLDIENAMREARTLMIGFALATVFAATWLVYLATSRLVATIERDRRALDERVVVRTARIEMLREMGSVLTACESVEEAGRIIRATVEKLVPASGGALALFKSSRNQLQQIVVWGTGAGTETQYPPSACWALRRGLEHYTTPGEESTRCSHLGEIGDASALCLPLQAHGETIGNLELVLTDGETLTGESRTLLKTLSEHAAVAIGNIRMNEVLREQAVRDPLTGLFNRRHLSESLDREIARAARHAQPLAVIMIDIDNFKAFNDRFGHEAGDLVLGAVGRLIVDTTRAEDIACRYGGEEFVIVLVGADAALAREVGERLCDSVRHLTLSFLGQPLTGVSISAGIAVLAGEDTSSGTLLRAADEMLYRAKQAGRDRVEVAEPESGE